MSLPDQTELEQALTQVAAGVHAVLPSDLDRHADLKVEFSDGNATIEVEENESAISHSVRVMKLQRKLKQATQELRKKQEKTQSPEVDEHDAFKTSESTGSSQSMESINDGVKDTIL